MKGVLFSLLVLLFTCVNSYAIDWYPANQATVEWGFDASYAEWVNSGSGKQVRFNIYIKDVNIGVPIKLTTDPINEILYTVTLKDEGKYYIGVSSVKILDNEVVSESDISWSNVPEVCAGLKDFGVKYFTQLTQPLGLRRY